MNTEARLQRAKEILAPFTKETLTPESNRVDIVIDAADPVGRHVVAYGAAGERGRGAEVVKGSAVMPEAKVSKTTEKAPSCKPATQVSSDAGNKYWVPRRTSGLKINGYMIKQV